MQANTPEGGKIGVVAYNKVVKVWKGKHEKLTPQEKEEEKREWAYKVSGGW